jgi:hypothetical protein
MAFKKKVEKKIEKDVVEESYETLKKETDANIILFKKGTKVVINVNGDKPDLEEMILQLLDNCDEFDSFLNQLLTKRGIKKTKEEYKELGKALESLFN